MFRVWSGKIPHYRFKKVTGRRTNSSFVGNHLHVIYTCPIASYMPPDTGERAATRISSVLNIDVIDGSRGQMGKGYSPKNLEKIFSGKHHVKFGHFIIFYAYIFGINFLPRKIDWASFLYAYASELRPWRYINYLLIYLTPARQAGTRFTYPGGMEGWVVLGYIPRWFTCPQTVTHSSSNRVRPRPTTYWLRRMRQLKGMNYYFINSTLFWFFYFCNKYFNYRYFHTARSTFFVEIKTNVGKIKKTLKRDFYEKSLKNAHKRLLQLWGWTRPLESRLRPNHSRFLAMSFTGCRYLDRYGSTWQLLPWTLDTGDSVHASGPPYFKDPCVLVRAATNE